MEFNEIKAKVCPNNECKQLIPEYWRACFENDFCPKCGYGHDEEKLERWRIEKLTNEGS